METEERTTSGRYIAAGSLALLAVVGFDLLLHGGVLSDLYDDPTPFLLDPGTAFRRIPLGYASFAVLIVLVEWLMARLRIAGFRRGAVFGLEVGVLVWLSEVLGLASISTARPVLLIGWFVGQTLELGVAGGILGAALAAGSLRPIIMRVVVFFAACVALGIVFQIV